MFPNLTPILVWLNFKIVARNSDSAVRRSKDFNDVDLARTMTHRSIPFHPPMIASNQYALTSHIAPGMRHFLNRTFGSVYPASSLATI